MINRNIIFPFLIILFSALALALTLNFEKPMYGDSSVDASFFPMIIIAFQILLCLVLIYQGVKKKSEVKLSPFFSKISIFSILCLILYAILISFIGYLYASIAAFVLYLIYFRVKHPAYYIVAIIFVTGVYLLFSHVFYISLPEGAWS